MNPLDVLEPAVAELVLEIIRAIAASPDPAHAAGRIAEELARQKALDLALAKALP